MTGGPSRTDRQGRHPCRVSNLDPGVFALAMATGVVSLAMRAHHPRVLATALLWLTGVEYVVLTALALWRLGACRGAAAADLRDLRRSPATLTFVAATSVLGTGLTGTGRPVTASALLGVAVVGWLVLGCVVPWAAVLGAAHRPGAAGAGLLGGRRVAVLFPPRPADLTPPYWIAMGATAITVVAGARIVEVRGVAAVTSTRASVTAAVVGFWAFGTWLVPPLLAAGIWRHLAHRVPLRYELALWSLVFPLGMWGVATVDLGRVEHLPGLRAAGSAEAWLALAVWTLTFAAMLAHLAHLAAGVRRAGDGPVRSHPLRSASAKTPAAERAPFSPPRPRSSGDRAPDS